MQRGQCVPLRLVGRVAVLAWIVLFADRPHKLDALRAVSSRLLVLRWLNVALSMLTRLLLAHHITSHLPKLCRW